MNNSREYTNSLRSIKKIHALRNKLSSCQASSYLLQLTNGENETAKNTLRSFGVKTYDVNIIKNIILKTRSDLNLLIKKQNKQNKQQSVDFWGTLAVVESALGYQIDINNVVLARWVFIIKELKKRSNGQRQDRGKRSNR